MKDQIYPLATLALVVLFWYASVIVFSIPPYLLPLPGDVISRLVNDFSFIMHHSWVTTYETVGGYILSIVGGIALSMAIVSSRTIDKALMPFLILSQTFPKVALAPLIVVWFGLGLFPKLIVTFLVAFFPIVISTVTGFRSLDTETLELSRSMRCSKFQHFRYFQLPFALPNILSGLKVAVALAVVGAVIAEWVGANEGLGYLLLRANADLDTTLLFAVLLMLMVIGVVLYYAVELLERLLIPWHTSQRLKHAGTTV